MKLNQHYKYSRPTFGFLHLNKISPLQWLLLHFILLSSCLSSSLATATFRPKALLLPITKDAPTLQYLTHINQRTPLVSLPLTVDLGGQFLWVVWDQDYVSSTYKPIHCRTAQCSLSRSKACGDCYGGPKPGCNKNTCGLSPDNKIVQTSTNGELTKDNVSAQSTDGSNPGRTVSVSNFLFTLAPTFLLQGLAKGVKGMAGLGRAKIGMPSLFSAAFSFPRKFAICLPSSTSSKGIMFFGNSPYKFLLNTDASQGLQYTPLILNPVSTAVSYSEGDPSTDYFIGVKSIVVNNAKVAINTTFLSIDKKGNGGTKISTVQPYTVLETSIYKAVLQAFRTSLAKVPTVKSVSPFGLCFNSASIGSTRLGPAVPQIELVLSNNVIWYISGANSMVQVSDSVLCLGFVDGRSSPRTSIVIGGHQIEDNLLQFDLARSRLGFSSSLLGRQTTCSNFNFTSNF